jgi:hypothetical protein
MKTPEQHIKALVEHWAKATSEDRKEDFLGPGFTSQNSAEQGSGGVSPSSSGADYRQGSGEVRPAIFN